jgi:hypothetical protein
MDMARRRQIVQGHKIRDSEEEIRQSTSVYFFLLPCVLGYEMKV